MSGSAQEYKIPLTKIIQKHMVILGPSIVLAKVRHISEIKVSDDGTVTEILGDGEKIKQQIRAQFSELSTMLVKKTMPEEAVDSSQPANQTNVADSEKK
jgi:hypothetical protein